MNPDHFKKYFNTTYDPSTGIALDDFIEDEAAYSDSKQKRRKNIRKKVERLRERIEAWCTLNGYDKMDNDVERKRDDGTIYYSRTDWEMVDDIEGLLINDATWLPHPNQLIKMNKLWKRYECK